MPVQDRYREYLSDQRRVFDELITEDWGTYISAEWDAVRRFEVAQLFAQLHPARILDIGCGVGFHDREMANHSFVSAVDAIDYSEKSVQKAEEVYPHKNVTRWVADLGKDQPQKAYDLVVSFQVFEHLDNPDTYFRYCRAACAENGHIGIFTPNRWRLRNVLRRLRGLDLELLDPQHFKEYSVSELRLLGERHGFEYVSRFGYGMNGLGWIDRRPVNARLRMGQSFPWIANCFCLLMKKRG
jgi:SAM-dependent methyltransferase